MKNKTLEHIIDQAKKVAKFSFYTGWDATSGYISGNIDGNGRFDTSFGFYIPIFSKNESDDYQDIVQPSQSQIEKYVENYFIRLAQGQEHQSTLRDFSHFVTHNYYINLRASKNNLMDDVEKNLSHLIKALEQYENFDFVCIQNFHNSLKNYECQLMDQEAMRALIEKNDIYKPEYIAQKLIHNEFGELVVPKKPKGKK